MSDEELIDIGWVSRAHGLAGELEIKLTWSSSDALKKAKSLFLTPKGGAAQVYDIEGMRRTAKGFLVRFVQVNNRTEAEGLKGATVSAGRAALPALAPDEYYLRDLVGVSVVAPDGLVGTVVRVNVYPSVDSAEIQLQDGGLAELPLVDDWVEQVDVKAGELRLHSRDGLIESESKKSS